MDHIRTSSAVSQGGRIITGRLLPGTDFITGVEKICRDNDVKYGVILSAIGSFSRIRFVYIRKDETAKMGIKYADPTMVEEPVELLACQGMIGLDDTGEVSVHLHGIMADQNLRLIGGHLVKGGNITLATVEVAIMELRGAELVRCFDEETGFPLFSFIERAWQEY